MQRLEFEGFRAGIEFRRLIVSPSRFLSGLFLNSLSWNTHLLTVRDNIHPTEGVMRQMSTSIQSKVMVLLLVGMLVTMMFGPQFVQARVVRAIGGDLSGEGDPLDSNDYSDAGSGGNSDNDIHELTGVPVERDGRDFIRSLLFKQGRLVLPLFRGSQVYFQILETPWLSSAAVEHEK